MVSNLERWFNKYKCKASPGQAEAGGKYDDRTGQTLFTSETKAAVKNCQKNAKYLQDTLPIEEIYTEVKAGPNSKHGLSEWISLRGESKLESWHDNVTHFGNSGMNSELSDCLNLCGTARYNLSIRHRLAAAQAKADPDKQKKPVVWQTVVSYQNHTELKYINDLAKKAGAENLPFEDVEVLPEDNGELFFSEYLEKKDVVKNHPNQETDHCPCAKCNGTQKSPPQQEPQAPALQEPTPAAPAPTVQHRLLDA